MNWDDVLLILRPALELTVSSTRANEWIEGMRATDDGELLGICLAIDVRNGAIDRSDLAAVVSAVVPTGDGRRDFSQAMDIVGRPLCATRLRDKAPTPDTVYARVLELGSFIHYYLRPQYHYSATEPNDVAEVRRVFFGNGTQRCHLGDINETWSGEGSLIWVLDKEDLQTVAEHVPSDTAATSLCEDLGLHLPDGVGILGYPELLLVTYPSDFESSFDRRCVQPTTFDANWARDDIHYISFVKRDQWGRTRSCSGAKPIAVKERVHLEFDGLTDDFYAEIVGCATPPTSDRSTITAHAYARLAM